MGFSLDSAKLSRIADGQPAIASDINYLFGQIETELNGVSNLAINSIGNSNIRNDAVTQAKINLNSFSPSSDYDPATKKYTDDYIDANANSFFGLETMSTKDSTGLSIGYDKYDPTSTGSIVQKFYKAQSDGMLTVIVRALNDTGIIANNYYGRLIIWVGQTSLLNYTLDGIDMNTIDDSQWDITMEPIYSGAFAMYDNYFRGGPVTAVIPIKKNDYFKILPVRQNGSGSLFSNSTSTAERIATYIRWQGLGSNLLPVLQPIS